MEQLKNKTILLVDDDERNIFALSSYLEAMDMNVVAALDGKEAIDTMEQGLQPDIVLLDIMMPVMDGYETLAAMKERGMLEKTPVIAVTAKAMKGDMEKCLEAGAWDYIAKPVDTKMLMEKIARLL